MQCFNQFKELHPQVFDAHQARIETVCVEGVPSFSASIASGAVWLNCIRYSGDPKLSQQPDFIVSGHLWLPTFTFSPILHAVVVHCLDFDPNLACLLHPLGHLLSRSLESSVVKGGLEIVNKAMTVLISYKCVSSIMLKQATDSLPSSFRHW